LHVTAEKIHEAKGRTQKLQSERTQLHPAADAAWAFQGTCGGRAPPEERPCGALATSSLSSGETAEAAMSMTLDGSTSFPLLTSPRRHPHSAFESVSFLCHGLQQSDLHLVILSQPVGPVRGSIASYGMNCSRNGRTAGYLSESRPPRWPTGNVHRSQPYRTASIKGRKQRRNSNC
jgi:hypothetical protein